MKDMINLVEEIQKLKKEKKRSFWPIIISVPRFKT